MTDYLRLPIGDESPNIVTAVVEIPQGSVNKYEYDKKLNVFRLDRKLFSPVHYPGDYGFGPRTVTRWTSSSLAMIRPSRGACTTRGRLGCLRCSIREYATKRSWPARREIPASVPFRTTSRFSRTCCGRSSTFSPSTKTSKASEPKCSAGKAGMLHTKSFESATSGSEASLLSHK